MKLSIFIFLLSCNQILAQHYNPFDKPSSVYDIIDRGDTFEIKYERYNDLKTRVDTLPMFSNDDDINLWRKVQLVTYFFDSMSIKMISFRDGERENYFFFFNGPDLSKVRIGYKETGKRNSCYYYTVANGLMRKDRSTLLAAGLSLQAKFYNHP